MRIDIRGRQLEVTDELHAIVAKRFERVGRQLSEHAQLDVELTEERNPAHSERFVAEATLQVKGTAIRAREAAPEIGRAITQLAENVRRQVKRHRELRRKRTITRRIMGRMREQPPPAAR